MKRIIFSLAAFVFIFCLAALPAFAADFTQLEYEEIDGSYRVHRAYSHRMNIVNRL